MFPTNRRNVAIAAGVVLLAGIGAAAWVHSTESSPSPAAATGPASAPTAALAPTPVVASYDDSQPSYGNSQTGAVSYGTVPAAGGSESGYYPSIPPPAYVSQPQPAPPPPEPAANAYAGVQHAAGVQYTGAGHKSYREYRARHHRRSKKRSLAIVAGTAATGAAIGAIAGGGPGAAIGAISGAGAGFVYDRLTHNHN